MKSLKTQIKGKKMIISKNQPCPCGSGKKYKKCCMNKSNFGYQLHLKGKNAENFVQELAKKSFLEDWCYMNPKLPNGKEICDLLIVYDDIAIIWQIKDLKVKDGKYNESEFERNTQQILTARNRLFELKLPIELDNPRRGKEIFNSKTIKKTYLISAVLVEDTTFFPLVEEVKGQIVHTFNREFTEIILSELDTIKDFIGYLQERESLISSDTKIMLFGGERELLAYYLMTDRSFKNLKQNSLVMIDEGAWKDFQKKPEYIAKKAENRISYGWDSMIDRAHECGSGYEKVARELARPNRFERRCLSKSFTEIHIKAHHEKISNHVRRLVKAEDTTYCFGFLDEHKPRKTRQEMIKDICFVARGIIKENKRVIGIATEMKIKPSRSYDFYFLEIPTWTKKEEKKMKEIQEKTGIFVDPKFRHVHEEEYPN